MTKLNLTALYSWISISAPLIQILEYLKKKQVQIDLLTVNTQLIGLAPFQDVSISSIKPMSFKRLLILFIRRLFVRPEMKQGPVICFDPSSLVYSYFFDSYQSYIYFSLELLDSKDEISRKEIWTSVLQTLEGIALKQCKLVIAQSHARLNRLQEKYSLNKSVLRELPNSSNGPIITEKSDFLKNKFNIPNDKSIVLIMGSLFESTCLFQILNAINPRNEKYFFVFHGWFPSPQIRAQFLEASQKLGTNVILSEELLEEKDKYKMIKSADVGCVFFDTTGYNLALALGSAGKLFDFARCGIPIVTNELPESVGIVEKNKIGLITNFNNLYSVLDQLQKIDAEDCYNYFKCNEFDSKFNPIYQEIMDLNKT